MAVMLLMMACGDTENKYTVGQCHFIFENGTHQDAVLASAMNANAPGIFCMVTKKVRSGAVYYDFTNSSGQSSSKLQNSIDAHRTMILGYNDGIIVGFSNLEGAFFAFDRECPNCFDSKAIPMKSYPLTMTTNGMAVCKSCQRQYDLNNNGFIAVGDNGKRMTRYRASTTGPFGTLVVN